MSSSNIGGGVAPGGVAPAGYGSPATATAPAFVVYRDAFTGKSLSSRRIDPVTKQYVYNSDGLASGMTTGQQIMLLAITTIKGSAAYKRLGQSFSSIKDITPNIERTLSDLVADATAEATRMRVLKVTGVVATRVGKSGEFVEINWVDLTTGEEQTSRA